MFHHVLYEVCIMCESHGISRWSCVCTAVNAVRCCTAVIVRQLRQKHVLARRFCTAVVCCSCVKNMPYLSAAVLLLCCRCVFDTHVYVRLRLLCLRLPPLPMSSWSPCYLAVILFVFPFFLPGMYIVCVCTAAWYIQQQQFPRLSLPDVNMCV